MAISMERERMIIEFPTLSYTLGSRTNRVCELAKQEGQGEKTTNEVF